VINTKPQSYADGDTGLAGEFFVSTPGPSGRRPGIMLVHGGAGLDDHARQQARRYAEPGQVRARLLVCHGAMDPHVPLADVTAFAEEMNAAGADWQLNMYSGAQHGFTHTDAKPGAIPGVAYHEQADTLSFAATRDFLARAFGNTR
jgi:dienelactone hydrolase